MSLSKLEPQKWIFPPDILRSLKQKGCDKPVILDPSDPFLEHLKKCSSLQGLLEIAMDLKKLGAIRMPSQLFDQLITAEMDAVQTSELFPQILDHFKDLKPFYRPPTNNVFRNVLLHLTEDQVNILIRRHPLSHDRIQILLEFILETNWDGYDLCFEYLRQISRDFLISSEALRSIGYLLQVINFRERIDFTMAELVKITGCIRIDSSELKRNRRDYERLYGIYRFLRFQNFPSYEGQRDQHDQRDQRDQHDQSFLSWIIQYSDNARFFHLDASELKQLFRVNSFIFTKVIGQSSYYYQFDEVVDVFARWLPFREGGEFVQRGIMWLVDYGRKLTKQDIKVELARIIPSNNPFMALFGSICLAPHLETYQDQPTTVFEVTALFWSAIIANNFQSGEDLGLTVTGLPSSGDLTDYTGLIRKTFWMFQCVWPDILICAGIIHITNTDGERFEVPPVVGREVPKPVINRLFARLQMEMVQDAVNAENAVHIIFWLLTLLPYDGKKQDVSNMISSIIASLIVCFKHTPNYDPEHDPTHEPEQCPIQLSILDSLDILFKYRNVERMMFEQIFCSQFHDDPQIWGMLLNDPLRRFEHLVFYQHRMDMSAEKKEDDASIIECSICTGQFSTANPGTVGAHLPIWAAFTGCGHSLCCSCSSKFPPTGANLSLVRCPFCRKESVVVLLKNTEFRICRDVGDAPDDAGNAGDAGDAGDAPDDSSKNLPPAKKPRSDE